MKSGSRFHADELVEVRSPEEIFATLDKNGQLEGLPFMPEMLAWSGKRVRVFKRAHKTCDPANGIGGRAMPSTVHLVDTRCDGSAHGGCQARCLLFWKDAWLKRVDESSGAEPNPRKAEETPNRGVSDCTEADVWTGTRKHDEDDQDPTFVCQATQVSQATRPLRWWDPRQYLEDFTSGNVRLSEMFGTFFYFAYRQLISAGLGLGVPLLWLYDAFQKLRGRPPYPERVGRIPHGQKTPNLILALQPGELVRIRSYDEILNTLDETNHNRGMWFDAEMVPYCGKSYRVLDRVNSIVDEKTGKLVHLKNDCIVLDKVVCQSCYAKYRVFCPRRIYAYWREIWLERVSTSEQQSNKSA